MDSIPQGQRIKEKIKIEKKSCGGGGFAQLFKGRHPKHGDVALKRMLWSMDGRGEDMLVAEVTTWVSLSHRHVLEFCGLYKKGRDLYMVSPWAENGSLSSYLRENPNADRNRFIRETADALYYLFQMNIIHGDIKGSNILVSGTSHVLLCDFGLSRLASVATLADLRGHGTPGYMAPELWGDLPKSFGTDIFAFGMTISEILSGNVPYHGYQLPHAIFLAISNGTRPPMEPKTSPTGESYEPMWKIAECCWKKEPEARPTISEVFKDLFTISSMRVPPKVPNIMTEAVGDIQSFDVVRADGRTKRMVLESGNLLSISRNLCTLFRGKGEDNQLYAIKCYPLPCQGSSFEEQLERFTQQTVDWQYLDHPFLLPFIGTARVEARFLYLISPWEEKRSLPEYLDRHADADRTRLIHEAAQALAYLHKGGIIHGRVKAGNILVGKRSQVLLCDYDLGGLVLVQGALGLEEYKDLRRDSPELWDGQSRSTKSDVYAFGMMIYEILSGRIPFYQYCDMITLTRVVKDKGELPPADPAHSLSGRSYSPLWDIARQCWIRNPNERPAMSDLLTQLDRKDLSITAGSAPNNGPQTVPFRKPMEYKAWLPTWSMRDIIPISFFSTIAAAGKVKYVTTYIGSRHKRIKVYPGPVVTGNFCEVFQGSEASLGTVALKRWRITTTSVTFEQQEMIDSEVATWKQLTHPSILPFLGTGLDKQNMLYLISPWMENGSLNDYIGKKPQCDRIRFLRETAEALVFVHDMGFVHGDLKAQNILVSPSEHALLCDYNLSKQELTLTIAGLKGTGSLPFQSPELWEGASRTRATDVYAFGMTIYQVLSGKTPFEQYNTHAKLLGAILKRGEVPPKSPDTSPSGTSYAPCWQIAERCWNREADERPTVATVLDSL